MHMEKSVQVQGRQSSRISGLVLFDLSAASDLHSVGFKVPVTCLRPLDPTVADHTIPLDSLENCVGL